MESHVPGEILIFLCLIGAISFLDVIIPNITGDVRPIEQLGEHLENDE